ncbi:MAG: RIP metalloprotease RseP [Planctomycetota bacterium]
MDLIHFLAALLGLSFLIFIHELGHFLAAKRVGIRVECFCIGFQPTIFGHRARFFAFKRGDTEYALGMVPFGGYVKMAGEELNDEKTGAGDEFGAKGVGERALVLVAGSVMNILLGLVLFVVAFRVGFDSESTIVGTAAIGGPAWTAGIRAGDKITAVNGEKVIEYLELATKVALGGTENPLTIDVERRDGESTTTHQFEVTPVKDPRRGLPFIGVSTSRLLQVGFVEADGAADKAGLEVDDRLTNVRLINGAQTWVVPSDIDDGRAWDLIVWFVRAYPKGRIECEREREGAAPATVTLQPAPVGEPPTEGRPVIGVYQQMQMIKAVQPHTPAADIFKPGMRIVAINGAPIRFVESIEVLRLAATTPEVRISFAIGDDVTVQRSQLLRWLGRQVVMGPGSNDIATVAENSAAARLGIQPGATLLQLGETAILDKESLQAALEAISNGKGTSREVAWHDGTARRTGTLTAAETDLGVTLASKATIGFIHDDSPAARAGLLAGDAIVQVADTPVGAWPDFMKSVVTEIPPAWYQFFRKESSFESKTVRVRIERGGETVEVDLTPEVAHNPTVGLGIKLNTTRLQSTVAEACVLGPKRGWAWTMRVFMTLKSLVKRDVAMKNLSGPVGIFAVGTAASKKGFGWYIFILAVISINLGIFNLLPFPILDGGHLAFLAVEKIKGSPVSERIQIWAFNIAFILLISLALFVTYNDILRLLGLG